MPLIIDLFKIIYEYIYIYYIYYYSHLILFFFLFERTGRFFVPQVVSLVFLHFVNYTLQFIYFICIYQKKVVTLHIELKNKYTTINLNTQKL